MTEQRQAELILGELRYLERMREVHSEGYSARQNEPGSV